jgi:hypothetical protein
LRYLGSIYVYIGHKYILEHKPCNNMRSIAYTYIHPNTALATSEYILGAHITYRDAHVHKHTQHTYIHTYIHTCIHTYIHTVSWLNLLTTAAGTIHISATK